MDDLDAYRRKRRFARTPEPESDHAEPPAASDQFVVHKHAARRLHYDLRLQFGRTLKSWAITRCPSLDPAARRLAVHVEDHPLSYASFEGVIPKGEYGAGEAIVWDRGAWAPMGDARADYAKGHLKFRLAGEKLRGGFSLVRIKPGAGGREQWLLVKERDAYAGPDAAGDERSVISGRTIEELRAAAAGPEPKPEPKPPLKRAARPLRAASLARVAHVRRAPPPDRVAPQLAETRAAPPGGPGWLREIKLDGYRAIARIERGAVRFLTRNGLDWTERYGALAQAFAPLVGVDAILDGEIVVFDEAGVSRFGALQDALAAGRSERLTFVAFDLLWFDGWDLREVPLRVRKGLLARALARLDETSAAQLGDYVEGDGARMLEHACRLGVEGIVSKRADAPYRSGRGPAWIKSKCFETGEFVIVGWTRSAGAGGLAALLLAERDGAGALRYAGKVGSGFTVESASDLESRLAAIARDAPAFRPPKQAAREQARWVEPVLEAEIRYATRTSEGRLRAPVFRGLRPDKAAPAPAGPERSTAGERWVRDADLAAVWVSNPDRVMFGGPTKLDLALYYARVGDAMLPELAGRPLTLVRCPSGRVEDCFYQRHASPGMPPAVGRIKLGDGAAPPAEGEPIDDNLYVEDAKGLLALPQFGVVELHVWGARLPEPEKPDRMIFDLDPDESLRWRDVVDAALFARDRLAELGLPPFVKTTGGKGVHLVVPLAPQRGWRDVGRFAEAFAASLAKRQPRRFTANMAKRRRAGRVYVDYLRNGRGATAVAAYSLRARPGLPVATPLSWDELRALEDPQTLTWATVPERLRRVADPWRDLNARASVITTAMAESLGLNEWKSEP